MNLHGNVRVGWIGDVMLVAAHGDFDDNAMLVAAAQALASVEKNAPHKWALLVVTDRQNIGGSMSTPAALPVMEGALRQARLAGCTHVASVVVSVVADVVYGERYKNAGIARQSFGDVSPAVAWLRSLGYSVVDGELQNYLRSA